MTKLFVADKGLPASNGQLHMIETDVLSLWRKESRAVDYQRDPEAWLWDVLRKRWWSKQIEVAHSFRDNTRTLVKSCNGVGKTQLAADLVSWFVSVYPPEDTSVLLTAPVRDQIDQMMFKYLRSNYALAKSYQNQLIGEITRWPKWVVREPIEKDIVVPKRPADANLVSTFQGVHDGHVAVVIDEAGGVPEDLLGAAIDAVTTNAHARGLGIGNPDRLNTGFHRRFTEERHRGVWNLITIGFDDSPNATGEMIYPDDPERDAHIKTLLVQKDWAERMRRTSLPGIIAAKVDGEFPKADDTTFFGQDVIERGQDNEIDPPETAIRKLGVDLSYQGDDKSAMYLNIGGHIRLLEEWNRDTGTEAIQSARRIHQAAISHGVSEVRVDRAGTGSGVYSNLITLEEFKDRPYAVLGINGGRGTPYPDMYMNARAWHYDQFRQGLIDRTIDIDVEDTQLRDELQVQPYKLTKLAQIQMTPKDEMRKGGIKSPDHLDAAIYSMIDVSDLTEGPTAGLTPGDTFGMDPFEVLAMETLYGSPV